MPRPLPRSFYARDAQTVARELLGKLLVRRVGGREIVGRIVKRPRIGVDYAGAWAKRLLRFCVRGNSFVSKP